MHDSLPGDSSFHRVELPWQARSTAEQTPVLSLLREDYATHGSKLSSPGFWALAAHRLGARIESSAPRLLRGLLTVLDDALASTVDHLWKIRIPRSTRVGRRVHLYGASNMFLHARAIGDDVWVGASTRFGPLCSSPRSADLPIIESGVRVGSGTRVLGAITVGRGATVGDGMTVLDSVAAGATLAAHRG